MKTLYQLEGEYRELMAVVAECGPELSDELSLALDRLFADMGTDEPAGLERYRQTIAKLEMEAAAAQAEAEQYATMALVRTNSAKRMKERVKKYLEGTGRTEATTSTGRKFAIQGNGGKQPLTVADDLNLEVIDPSFVRVVKTLDKDAVYKAIQGGEAFPWAKLEERGTQLRIR